MRRVLSHKFTFENELGWELMSTGSCKLIEDSPWDKFWGIGKDGKGKNILGILLEERRAILMDQLEEMV
jgi:ribA/ribD-fused uncharacterized protein